MKQLFFLSFFTLQTINIWAQNATVAWGDDQKIKRGTTELNIITADQTGLYLQEGGIRYFSVGFGNMSGVKFRKFDKFYNEVYVEDYKSELKGKSLNRIVPFKNRLYIFADDYDKKEKRFLTYAAEIDKNSGKLKADWKEIAVIPRENRSDDYEFTIVPSADSSVMVLVADISNKDFAAVKVLVMNEALEQQSVTDIKLEFAKNSYSLQDVLLTADKKILVSGKVYEEVEYKKKRTRLVFKKIAIEKYDLTGKKELDITTADAGKLMISAKLLQNKKGDLFICGFYSNDVKTKEINGLLVNRIDLGTGKILLSTDKPMDQSMIGKFDDDADDDKDAETKQNKAASQKAKDDDEMDGFSSDFLFRNAYIGQDNSILLVAEKFKLTRYTRTERNYSGQMTTYRTVVVYQYVCGDLLTIKIGEDGSLKWVNILPKQQVENYSARTPSMSTMPLMHSSFFLSSGLPFYSSFFVVPFKNKLIYFYNDNEKNAGVKSVNDKPKSTYNFNRTSCYALSLDLTSGDVTRKFVFSNFDEPVAMVRHGMLSGNEFYLVAFRPTMLGKSKLKIGKINIR